MANTLRDESASPTYDALAKRVKELEEDAIKQGGVIKALQAAYEKSCKDLAELQQARSHGEAEVASHKSAIEVLRGEVRVRDARIARLTDAVVRLVEDSERMTCCCGDN